MKRFHLAGLAALALVMSSAAQAQTIKIGVMLPYSGVNADLGTQIDKAFDLYVKLHAKDIAPYKVEIIKRDEGPPSGANAKTVATELITRDKVDILAGVVFSPSAIAMAPVLTQAKKPLAIANAGTAWIPGLSPYIVRFSFSMWHPAYPMGQYAAKDLGCKTAAMGYTDFPPGKDSTEAFKTGFEKNGGKIIESIPMGNPAQVPDMTPFFTRVKDAKPDCFYVFIPSGSHASAVVKYYGEVGLKQAGIKLIGPMDVAPDNKLAGMGDAAIGTIIMSHYSRDLENPANKEFLKAWEAEYGKNFIPDFMSAQGWDTMAAIFDTIRKLKGDFSNGDKVIEALKNYKGNGPRGPIAIDPATRDVVQDEHAMEVIKKADGTLGHKVLGTIKQVKDQCKELKVGRCGGN
jgi:branched-chain amino acid transport system substrate-binding protein